MAITLRYLIVTFTLLSAGVLLRAQPTEPKVPVRTTTVQFYYYTVADNSMVQVEPDINLWLQSSRKNKVKVDIVPGGSGTPLTFAGNGPLELFTEVSTEKGIERKVVATLPLPPEVKGVFYIVTYTPGYGFKFTPLPYTNKDVPLGSVRVINLCPIPLQIKIGDKLSLVEPQSQELYSAGNTKDFIPVKVARMRKEQWRMFIETTLPGLKERPSTLYVFVPESKNASSARLLQLGDLADPPEMFEGQ